MILKNFCTEASRNFQVFCSFKINLAARIPKTEIYLSIYYSVFYNAVVVIIIIQQEKNYVGERFPKWQKINEELKTMER